jgi:hypothetical protein
VDLSSDRLLNESVAALAVLPHRSGLHPHLMLKRFSMTLANNRLCLSPQCFFYRNFYKLSPLKVDKRQTSCAYYDPFLARMSISAMFKTKYPSLLLSNLSIFGVTKENQEPGYRRRIERDKDFPLLQNIQTNAGARSGTGFPSRG